MKKRALSVFVAVLMLFSAALPAAAANPYCKLESGCPAVNYRDLDKHSKYDEERYHEATDFVILRGWMLGTNDKVWFTGFSCTRAHLIATLWKIDGMPTVDFDINYTDVKENSWFLEPVRWGASLGIATGMGDGSWGQILEPDPQTVLTVLWRYCKYRGLVPDGFTPTAEVDLSNIQPWARDAVLWGASLGMYEDFEGFLKLRYLSREQVAEILMFLHREIGLDSRVK